MIDRSIEMRPEHKMTISGAATLEICNVGACDE
jgi:hypothetical protein